MIFKSMRCCFEYETSFSEGEMNFKRSCRISRPAFFSWGLLRIKSPGGAACKRQDG